MFRTGLGNPVALKPSSIAKAHSVLRDVDDSAFTDAGETLQIRSILIYFLLHINLSEATEINVHMVWPATYMANDSLEFK